MKKINSNLVFLMIFVFFAFLTFSANAANVPAEQTVNAEGQGTDSNSAKLDAFRNAISQVVGVYIQSDTVVENYVTKSDKIKAQTQGFIKTSKKLSESKGSDGIVSVTYSVTVSAKKVEADVKAVMGAEFSSVGHPIVCVVGWYDSKDRAEDEINKVAVTAMNRALLKKGYKVVDQWTIAKLRAEDKAIVAAAKEVTKDDFANLALAIANDLKADIYVTTYGSVDNAKSGVTTKMYSSYTAQIFGDDTGYGTVKGSNLVDVKKAVDEAVSDSMARILPMVSDYWQQVINDGAEYVIILENYKDGDQRRIFKDILKSMDGVSEVKQLNAAAGHAEFSVYVKGTLPSDFFDDIISETTKKGLKIKGKEAVIRGGRAIFILI